MAQQPSTHEQSDKIGPYLVLNSLGKGGMGEVFLVYDPLCERKIALKKILPELSRHPTIQERFLREARFAAKLSHPCIIPIHYIQEEGDVYYTMPYIEGETLKTILQSTSDKEASGYHDVSIPALTRIFLSVCQALAYSHSKSILHRDLKPDNIIIGKYGEVFLLDWGIATHLDEVELEELNETFLPKETPGLTRPGKVVGTVNFMAPERALKQPATVQTEIYSLGVILYQILSLRLPFFRKNIEHFRRIMKLETFVPPEEIAPYRDIPKQLSYIAQKCLAMDPKDRYQTLHELIFDLENYIEGKPEWMLTKELNINETNDWELQENIPLSKHLAISRLVDELEWIGLMISKEGFSGNLKLEMEIKLPADSKGIGILMCVPSPAERQGLEDGYCLWLSGANHPYAVLFRSNAEILSIPSSGIKDNQSSHLCIEKIDNTVLVYIDGHLKLSYMSHIPLIGSYMGFIHKNSDFDISTIRVYTGAQAVMVNCLSVPDAFLISKHFDKAFAEYKKIAESFQGRTEGREAQFRAGITLLEQGKRERYRSKQHLLFSQALEEFECLKNTPGAPLEYLGKALVYYALQEEDEERKCLELAIRKYPKHPLLSVLKEHILFRLYESSQKDVFCTYHLTLLCLRHMPDIFASETHRRLLEHLMRYGIPLAFVNPHFICSHPANLYIHYAIELAFRLNQPLLLVDMLESLPDDDPDTEDLLLEGCFALLLMHHSEEVLTLLETRRGMLKRDVEMVDILVHALSDTPPMIALKYFMDHLPNQLSFDRLTLFMYLVREALSAHSACELLTFVEELSHLPMQPTEKERVVELHLMLLLLDARVQTAAELLATYPLSLLNNPTSSLYFVYGCYVWITEGKPSALEHFKKAAHSPHLGALVEHLLGTHKTKETSLLHSEKEYIYERLFFLYSVTQQKRAAAEYKKKLAKLR